MLIERGLEVYDRGMSEWLNFFFFWPFFLFLIKNHKVSHVPTISESAVRLCKIQPSKIFKTLS
jgi:hypothetical protein